MLVLAGALAAGNRSRIHDAVVLKTLGATRATLIRAYVYEYGLLGLATALFALAFGGVASWFVVTRIMTLPSRFMPDIALATLAGALALGRKSRIIKQFRRFPVIRDDRGPCRGHS